jgi:CHASE2 domain-containing sensor protein
MTNVFKPACKMMAIDGQSIANIGHWFWPHDMYTKMLGKLSSAQVEVIGNTVYFLEPPVNSGLGYINKISTLVALYVNSTSAHKALQLDAMLTTAQSALSSDAKLAVSIKRCVGLSS